MATIDWSKKCLTDSDVVKLLEELGENTECEELDLWSNKLTRVPELTKYKQFRQLKVLNLGVFLQGNLITILEPSRVPGSVTRLRVGNNKLSELGDLSQHKELRVLYVSYNNIRVLEAHKVPTGITNLYVHNNKLEEVGDLSQHKQLQELHLSNNLSLHTLHGLPDRDLLLYTDNTNLQVLGQKCFHIHTYSTLKRLCNTQRWMLKQPPVHILNQGLDNVLKYYEENSVRSTQTSFVLVGLETAGKSSLVESLITGTPILIDLSNRTQVTEIKAWHISAVDTILIFDQGGHPIYAITSPIFIAPSSTVLLVHDVTKIRKKELDRAAGFLRQMLQYCPENQVHLVLTHTDIADAVSMKRNEVQIKQVLHTTIDEQMQAITRHPVDDDTDEKVSKQKLLALLEKQRNGMKCFLVSSKTYHGIQELKQFLAQLAIEGRVSVPERWIEFYNRILKEQKMFIELKDLTPLFRSLYSPIGRIFQPSKITQTFESALQYYTDTGQFLYYGALPVLKEYVFHRKEVLIDILKACFHHNLRDVVNFQANPLLQHLFPESQLELILQQYEQEGILSMKLLRFLLQNYGLKLKEQDVIVELLKLFHICYPIDVDSHHLFMPWFVENNECPSTVDQCKLWHLDKTNFSVQLDCMFWSCIPINAFEMILVQLQKSAVKRKYGGQRLAWKDGLLVQIGSLECVALRKPNESTISICVQGHTEDLETIWQVMREVHGDLEPVLDLLLGVLRSSFFNCNHCKVMKKHPIKKWLPKEVFQMEGVDILNHKCNGDVIPTALVVAIPVSSQNVTKHIEHVQSYLAAVCKEQAPPGKMLYFDCDELSEGEFELSWCWPECPEDHPDASVDTDMAAVVEYRQDEEWRLFAEVKQCPYKVQCNAKEFRVAAKNESGTGEFVCGKPCRVVNADERISETDQERMIANHESLSKMTSVQLVLLRLFSRRVIGPAVKERLIRQLKNEGPQHSADQLMEAIYRLDYHKLYLFQKTLRETGQIVRANSIPVQLEEYGPAVRVHERKLCYHRQDH